MAFTIARSPDDKDWPDQVLVNLARSQVFIRPDKVTFTIVLRHGADLPEDPELRVSGLRVGADGVTRGKRVYPRTAPDFAYAVADEAIEEITDVLVADVVRPRRRT